MIDKMIPKKGHELLAHLTEREAAVLRKRFGLPEHHDWRVLDTCPRSPVTYTKVRCFLCGSTTGSFRRLYDGKQMADICDDCLKEADD